MGGLKDLFQSTLPRRERRRGRTTSLPFPAISIHAPAKGATKRGRLRTSAPFISIHAPAKGATNIYRFAIVKGTFQSTLPRRERLSIIPPDLYQSTISIHAPAKGATELVAIAGSMDTLFQSTLPRRERRCAGVFTRAGNRDFNPRSREGSDGHTTGKLYAITSNFNPRSREGSDAKVVKIFVCCGISIHAPAKGATRGV